MINEIFFSYILYVLLFLFIYLLFASITKNYKISKRVLIVLFLFYGVFYSYKIYNVYFKKPTIFMTKILDDYELNRDSNITKKVLNLTDDILNYEAFLTSENFEKYGDNFVFQGFIHAKRYKIIIFTKDRNITKAIIFSGYDAM